jgi:hypothetical protein
MLLYWVSFLTSPNFFEIKGFVVVVIVLRLYVVHVIFEDMFLVIVFSSGKKKADT